ncbi:MAG: ATP-grasp domain-containing protein [Treponema sp.]|nr:ATP-grasp domain-containing protein [Treponema sp.]
MESLKGKRLLVLGGSIWKDAIKSFADEHGVYLISAGLYPAGTDEIAQEYYRIDTTKAELMKPFIREHKIDGVYMGGSELIISSACEYINELGLPCYATKAQWNFLQDKRKFKELCLQYDLPVVPKFSIDTNNINNSIPIDTFPVIIKPTDGCGSKGFSVCNNIEELEEGYNRAKAASPSGSVICEKFVKNDACVFFATFSNGKMIFSGLEDKIPVMYEKERSYVGGIFLFQSKLIPEFRRLFEKKLQNLFQSIGIKEGSVWIEVFYDNGQYFFNEVGFRYGGSVSIYPVDYFYGINQVASDIYFALTGKSCIIGHKSLISNTIKRKKYYCAYPVHMKAGKIYKIKGVEQLCNNQNIILVSLNKNEGDCVAQTGSFSQVIALVHFIFDDLKDCKKMVSYIHETFIVTDEKNENLIDRKLKDTEIRFLGE